MAGIKYEEFLAVLGDERHPLYRDYKERRQIAKSLTFSILYGSTAAGIALALGIERKEADRLIALYFNAFPGIKQYIEDTHSMARENGYIISPFGQIKWEFGTEEMYKGSAVYNAALRNAQNVRIQGTTSTLGLITFATLNEALKKIGCRAICTVKWRPSREILIE
jgi:DNA polymerase-1